MYVYVCTNSTTYILNSQVYFVVALSVKKKKVASECNILNQIISLLIRSNKYIHWLEYLSSYLINIEKLTKTK